MKLCHILLLTLVSVSVCRHHRHGRADPPKDGVKPAAADAKPAAADAKPADAAAKPADAAAAAPKAKPDA